MLAGLPVVAAAGYHRFFYGNEASSFIELYATYEERQEKLLLWDYSKDEMESSNSSEVNLTCFANAVFFQHSIHMNTIRVTL